MAIPKISRPYKFPRIDKKIHNRAVLAAMTNKQSYENGIISDDEIAWLLERAKGGFGIITTAATNVSYEGKAWNGEFGVYDDYHLPSLTKLTSTIHKTESLIIAQLFHGGMRSPEVITGQQPLSASELKCKESINGVSFLTGLKSRRVFAIANCEFLTTIPIFSFKSDFSSTIIASA